MAHTCASSELLVSQDFLIPHNEEDTETKGQYVVNQLKERKQANKALESQCCIEFVEVTPKVQLID